MLGGLGKIFESEQKTSGSTESQLWGWKYAMPGVRAATELAAGAVGQPLQYFPGQTYAAQTSAERQAIEQMLAGAGAYPGLLASVMDPGMAGYLDALNAPGAALGMGLQDVANNPALQGIADAMTGQLTRNLTENILPNLTTQFMGYGGLGGTRQGVAEGLAVDRTNQALSDSLASLYGNAWSQGLGAETSRYLAGLQAQQGALGQMSNLASLGLTEYGVPADLLGRAGVAQRTEKQRAIDEAMARFNFEQMEPWQRAEMGLGLLMDPAMRFGIQTGSFEGETVNQPSMWSNIGRVASLAASIYGGGMLGGAMGALGGGAAGGGAGAGAGGGSMFANPWTSFAR